ncbi:MAG: methyltransferase domain-containing protein [Bdellovibrionales bacterium]|nr:methyltransferase domain-containing protein [Bdellovibrionales bacterium]
MKIHRPIVEGMAAALSDIFNLGYFADKVLERTFKAHRKWGGRDRRFVAEGVYDIVRWWRRYLKTQNMVWSDEQYVRFRGEKDAPLLLSEEDLLKIIVSWMVVKKIEVPEWLQVEFSIDDQYIMSTWESVGLSRSERLSLSDWMDQLGSSLLSDRWEAQIASMNQPAPVFLRVNTLKARPQEVVSSLEEEEIESRVIDEGRGTIEVNSGERRPNVFQTQAYKKGWFEVQDGGSQWIAPFLQVEPGQRVIDACAGAGGKSLHLATLMQNKGRIISMDVEDWKLKELRKRSSRAGLDIIETRAIDSTKVIKRLKEQADRLLLDVPCTGVGVLRRNPDSKWRLTEDRYLELLKLQSEIIERYSQMVKPGGKMVYATCSLWPTENEEQVKAFLSSHGSQWELEEEKIISPAETSFDGFYMARLVRKSTSS